MRIRGRRTKVFCVGRNKTGTTSIGQALVTLGYRLGHQGTAEGLMEDWGRRDFRRIVEYCRSADAFQDVPFSLEYTYQAVDVAFPGSKFVLTVRKSADEWFESSVSSQARTAKVDRVPTADDLRACRYHQPGFLWRQQQLIYRADETTLYDRARYTSYYERHNEVIRDYFAQRPDDLLVLDVSEPAAMERLCAFLGHPFTGQQMPHLNRAPWKLTETDNVDRAGRHMERAG